MTDLFLRAAFASNTANHDDMTVRVVWSTGAAIPRQDARGMYLERLDLAGADLSRIIGAPVLNQHRQTAIEDILGVVDDASSDGHATVRFSKRHRPVFEDVKAGNGVTTAPTASASAPPSNGPPMN